MRVSGRIAVAREVLRADRNATAMEAFDRGHNVAGDERGGGAERANTDDGIARIGIDVRTWSKRQVDAETPDSLSEIRVRICRQAGLVDEAERSRARRIAAGCGIQSGHIATLFVDGDDDVRASGA